MSSVLAIRYRNGVFHLPGYRDRVFHLPGRAGYRKSAKKCHPSTLVVAKKRYNTKMASASASFPRRRLLTGFCPSVRCSRVNKWISFMYGLGTSQTATFALGPEPTESVCGPLQRGISSLCNPIVLLKMAPLVFKARYFGGLMIFMQSQGLRHKPLTSLRETPYLWDPSWL